MGNAFASGRPTSDHVKEPDLIQDEDKIMNPGTIEDLHKRARDVFPSTLNGAVVSLHKRLSDHFQVYHTINLNKKLGNYRFGASYDGGSTGPSMVGEMDPSGNLSASVTSNIGSRMSGQLRAQMSGGQCAGAELRTDFRTVRSATTFAALNPALMHGLRGAYVLQHLHAATRRLALGAELACQRSDRLPGGHLLAMALVGRYVGEDFEASATLGATTIRLCYYQRASSQLRLAVETEANLCLGEAVTRLGYRVDLPYLQFRASFDTNLIAEAALEKRMDPMPFTLTLTGRLDHRKNVFDLGVGFVGVIA